MRYKVHLPNRNLLIDIRSAHKIFFFFYRQSVRISWHPSFGINMQLLLDTFCSKILQNSLFLRLWKKPPSRVMCSQITDQKHEPTEETVSVTSNTVLKWEEKLEAWLSHLILKILNGSIEIYYLRNDGGGGTHCKKSLHW